MSEFRVSVLDRFDERELRGLADVLIDCVEGGDSVSFMLPITRAKADAFWQSSFSSAQRGERQIVIAENAQGEIVGTVSVIWAQPENQPHRADVAKMLVHRRARRRGIGAMLLNAAESIAREAGRTVLVLDTASKDAERLYERGAWQRCGVIPKYALMPDGPFCDTVVFYKVLG